MIPASLVWRAGAFGAAVAVHVAVVMAMQVQTRVEIEASAGHAQASLGSGFADMVAGMTSAAPVDTAAEVPEPDGAQVEPVEMHASPQARAEASEMPRPDPAGSPDPKKAASAAPHRLSAVAPNTVKATGASDPARQAPLMSQTTPASDLAMALTGTPAAEVPAATRARVPTAMRVSPDAVAAHPVAAPPPLVAAAPPGPPSPTAVPPKPEAQTGAETSPSAVARSLRPPTLRIARQPAQTPAPKPRRTASAPGNAAQNQVTGVATGARTAPAAVSGTPNGQNAQQGNAAATNYPGQVMRKISRVARPSVGARGESVVVFRIGAGGRLENVSIAKSSGSLRLDNAAIRVIQRAAPFPPPPQGARRSFSITIVGG